MNRKNRQPVSGSVVMSLIAALSMAAGCTLLPVTHTSLHAAPNEMPAWTDSDVDQASQLMYEIMVAELAGRRGYVDIATEGYFSASQRSGDPRVAERATRLAAWARRWQQAEQAGDRWLELDPGNREARRLMAQVYMRQGRSEQAAAALDALIRKVGDSEADATTVTSMDEIYTFLQREPNRKVALETMSTLRDLHEDDADVNLVLSRLALELGKTDEAMAAADKALELDADNSEAVVIKARILSDSGRSAEGFEVLTSALEKSPDDNQLRLGYTTLLIESGRFEQAAREMETLYESAGDDPDVMLSISMLALETRRIDAARKYFEKLVSLGAHLDVSHYYLGRIADTRQEFETAIQHYSNVQAGTHQLDASIRVAELTGLLGDTDAARTQLHLLAASTGDPAVRTRLIRAEATVLQQGDQHSEALAVLSDGLEEYPADPDLRYNRALLAENLGDHELFIADMRALIEADPGNAHALNALGYHFANENINLDEAEEFLVRANELLPDDPAILDSLGWLKYRRGNHEDSITLLRQAWSLLQDAEIAAHLGEVLWVSGEQDSAMSIWNEALSQQPDDEVLREVMERYTQ